MDCSTHDKGHTLDLVIPNGSFVSQLSTSDLALSDHRAVFFNMELPDMITSTSRIINYRKWKSIEPSDFSDFIDSFLSCDSLSDDLDDNVSMLNSVLLSGLDTLAPLKSRSVSFARSAPWYNDDLRAMKVCVAKWSVDGVYQV